jgi:purine-binding chemotaxis protein CheW
MSETTAKRPQGSEAWSRPNSTDTRQFCTLHLAGHLFGVPVMRVQEVISYQAMTRVPLANPVIDGLINLRGQIVTAIDLRKRLDFSPRETDQRSMNVVVQTPGGVVSLLVDQIGDVVEVEEAIYEAPPETLTGIAKDLILGVYKFEDRLLLELDIDKAVCISSAIETAA